MTTSITHESRHALREYVLDPGALPPACDEHEFAALIEGMVADEAPRLFAVVQEYGERVDAVIAAWGMAFPDHAEIVAHRLRMSVRDPESALRMFDVGSHIRAHLVWFNPDAATPTSSARNHMTRPARQWHRTDRCSAGTDLVGNTERHHERAGQGCHGPRTRCPTGFARRRAGSPPMTSTGCRTPS